MVQKDSTKKINELTFALNKIQVFNFSLDNSPEHQKLPLNHPYTFELNSGILVDHIQKLLGIDFILKIFKTQNKKDKVCELSLRMSYSIQNFDEVVIKKGNGYKIPEPAIQHLIAVTVSTSRGILYEKVQGSFLSNVVLPIINVTNLKKIKSAKPLIK